MRVFMSYRGGVIESAPQAYKYLYGMHQKNGASLELVLEVKVFLIFKENAIVCTC